MSESHASRKLLVTTHWQASCYTHTIPACCLQEPQSEFSETATCKRSKKDPQTWTLQLWILPNMFWLGAFVPSCHLSCTTMTAPGRVRSLQRDPPRKSSTQNEVNGRHSSKKTGALAWMKVRPFRPAVGKALCRPA